MNQLLFSWKDLQEQTWYNMCHVTYHTYHTFTHLLPSIWMSILSPHDIVTPGTGDELGTVDRLWEGVGLGTKDELGAWDILGTGGELDVEDEATPTTELADNQNAAFMIFNSCKVWVFSGVDT